MRLISDVSGIAMSSVYSATPPSSKTNVGYSRQYVVGCDSSDWGTIHGKTGDNTCYWTFELHPKETLMSHYPISAYAFTALETASISLHFSATANIRRFQTAELEHKRYKKDHAKVFEVKGEIDLGVDLKLAKSAKQIGCTKKQYNNVQLLPDYVNS